MGGPWQRGWGPQDDDDSVAAIHAAVRGGVNWIDTAPAYGFGHSEEVIGRVIAELPDGERPLVFTKCGLIWKRAGGKGRRVGNPESLRRECHASLERLGIERIDLLQMHYPPEGPVTAPLDDGDGSTVEESWAELARLVDEGLVRCIGASNFSVEQLERCEAIRHVDSMQPRLSLIDRRTADLLAWCEQNATGVITYSPLQSGLLSGRFSRERVASLGPDDWRRDNAEFTANLDRNLELVAALEEIAADIGCTLPELAIAWVLRWPGVSGVIVGGRTVEQVTGWLGAIDVVIDDRVLDRIAAALERTGAGAGPTVPPIVGSRPTA